MGRHQPTPLSVARLAMIRGATLREAATAISVSPADLDLALWRAIDPRPWFESAANKRLTDQNYRRGVA